MRTEARFPGVAEGAGHYESFFVKATRPGGGQGIWLRHTVHKRPGAAPTGAIWLTLFDAGAPGPRAANATVPASELSVPDGAYIRVGQATLAPGRATGSLALPELEASWDIAFEDAGEPFLHLPYRRLYSAPLPRTKILSPHPCARFEGTLTLGDEAIGLEGWPGMVGHNWGAEHAERWVWIQGPALHGQAESCFDLAAGRIKLGPVTTPWVANGVLRLDGREHRLGGLDRALATRIRERPAACEFELGGEGVRVRGRVAGEPRNFVAWIYADPKGPEHHTLNCSIADLELELTREGAGAERIELSGCAAYEIGMRETDHGIPLQPYEDG